WTENANARINAAGFDAAAILADFSVRGAENGIPTSIIYSDGVDVWVAESNEANATGWAWQNTTKVFDATAPDWYRYVALFGDRKTPINRLYAAAVYYDDAPGAVQYVRLSEQSTPGDITGWDAAEDVSNVANTDRILGVAGRSMGKTGPTKKEIIVVYKEGIAIRSRYHKTTGWEAIQDVDATTIPSNHWACFDIEHYEEIHTDIHIIYIDADGAVRTAERLAGAAEVWGPYLNIDTSASDHLNVAIAGMVMLQTFLWQDSDTIGYRVHLCVPETWVPPVANPYYEFSPANGIVATTDPPDQILTTDGILGGDAVPITWIGEIATPCELGWGILFEYSAEDLYAHLVVRNIGTADLYAHLVIKNIGSAETYGHGIIRNIGSAEAYGHGIIRNIGSAEAYGHGIIRNIGSAEAYGHGIIRNIGSAELYGHAVIRQTRTLELPGQLWVRWPPRFWTNRRYINGVIDLDEKLLGDAVLEYVIEGVMEDIQGYLENADLAYSSWTNITLIPIQILRAATYGVVAALY
ncbi:hypothetical protein LCGC14_2431920, partial [marine sediment metagenome]